MNEHFSVKMFIVFFSRFVLDMIKHIFLIQINNLKPQIYLEFFDHFKEFICCTRLIEKNSALKHIEQAAKLDIKEVSLIESKVIYPAQKCAFKLYLVIIPHFCLVMKQLIYLMLITAIDYKSDLRDLSADNRHGSKAVFCENFASYLCSACDESSEQLDPV